MENNVRVAIVEFTNIMAQYYVKLLDAPYLDSWFQAGFCPSRFSVSGMFSYAFLQLKFGKLSNLDYLARQKPTSEPRRAILESFMSYLVSLVRCAMVVRDRGLLYVRTICPV